MSTYSEQDAMYAIVKKAWGDPKFKEELLNNPVPAIKEHFGYPVNIPEGKQLKVVDQSDESTIYINIPVEPNMEDCELDENQLDAVSGGNGIPIAKPQGIFGN